MYGLGKKSRCCGKVVVVEKEFSYWHHFGVFDGEIVEIPESCSLLCLADFSNEPLKGSQEWWQQNPKNLSINEKMLNF